MENKKKVDKSEKVKPVKKVVKKDVNKLNETVNDKVVVKDEQLQKCQNCGNLFDKGMTICPKCRKKNNVNFSGLFFIVFGLVFLFVVILFHFIDKYVFDSNSYDDYIVNCTEVTYNDLVRVPKNYLSKDVAVLGVVSDVSGISNGISNSMDITVNLNIFDDGVVEEIVVHYEDKNFEHGFLNGDIVKVYGEYDTINGNIPYINAKYVEIVK